MSDPMIVTVAYDGSECADSAIDDLARAGIPTGSTVHIVSVSEWFPAPVPDGAIDVIPEVHEPDIDAATAIARQGSERLRALRPDLTIETAAVGGSPARHIVEYAEEKNSDLIVVGSHGRSALERLFVGSISHQVLNGASSSVRISRSSSRSGPPVVMAAIDGSPYTGKVIEQIRRREWPEGTTILLVTSAPYSYDRDEEKAALRQLTEQHHQLVSELEADGLRAESIIDTSEVNATHAILARAKEREVDMIILGARGLTGFERFMMGSVSSTIALRAECSVEVAR